MIIKMMRKMRKKTVKMNVLSGIRKERLTVNVKE